MDYEMIDSIANAFLADGKVIKRSDIEQVYIYENEYLQEKTNGETGITVTVVHERTDMIIDHILECRPDLNAELIKEVLDLADDARGLINLKLSGGEEDDKQNQNRTS